MREPIRHEIKTTIQILFSLKTQHRIELDVNVLFQNTNIFLWLIKQHKQHIKTSHTPVVPNYKINIDIHHVTLPNNMRTDDEIA